MRSRHTAHTLRSQVIQLKSFRLGILYKYAVTFQTPSLSVYPPSSVYKGSAGPSSATLRKPAGYGRLYQDVCIFIIHRRRSKLESPDCWDFLSMHSVLKFAGTSHSILASCPHMKKVDLCLCVSLIGM